MILKRIIFSLLLLLPLLLNCSPSNKDNNPKLIFNIPSTISHTDFVTEMALSPVPIITQSRQRFKTNYINKQYKEYTDEEYEYVSGMFLVGPKIGDYPPIFIFIDEDMSSDIKIVILFHEIGHFYCYMTDCECKDDRVMSEEHAYHYMISKSIQKKNVEYVSNSMALVDSTSRFAKKKDYHHKAAKKIIKSDLWQYYLGYLVAYQISTLGEYKDPNDNYNYYILTK
jgi:hypothetical protein